MPFNKRGINIPEIIIIPPIVSYNEGRVPIMIQDKNSVKTGVSIVNTINLEMGIYFKEYIAKLLETTGPKKAESDMSHH